MLSTFLFMQTPTATLGNGKYVKCRTNLRSRNIYNLSPFSGKNEMAKFEKNMNKSGMFLTIYEDDSATITTTTLLYQLVECN